MTVAYLTADLDRVKAIFSDPDKFLTADEFLFLFAVVLVFAFGPGKFSIDWLIKRLTSPSSAESAKPPFEKVCAGSCYFACAGLRAEANRPGSTGSPGRTPSSKKRGRNIALSCSIWERSGATGAT